DVARAVVPEVVDATVLEEASYDRAHTDVLGQAGNAGAQRAHPAHDQVELHARLARLVELLDHARLQERVDLRGEVAAPPRLRMLRLAADRLQHAVVQRERRLQQRVELAGLAQPGEP